MPAISPKTTAKVLFFATMLAPALIVQLVRSGLGSAPVATAAAATQPAPAVTQLATASPHPLTDAQKRALAWVLQQPNAMPIRSPMDFPDPAPAIIPDPAPAPVVPAQAAVPLEPVITPAFHITGMIGSAPNVGIERALASINHRIYRVGDEVSKGWIVHDIDSRNRTVTLHGPDGKVVSLTPPKPELERP